MTATNKLQPITENSCLVNVMHEILVDRWNKGIPSISVCPSQHLERFIGFDVALPEFDKLLVLQFKAYKRYNNKPSDYFMIYNRQHKTLLHYPQDCAFYVFPDYKTHEQMISDRLDEYSGRRYKILNNTWFVEVNSIPSGAKKVYRNDLHSGHVPSMKWQTLSRGIRSCMIGFRIAKIREHYVLIDPREGVVEVIKIPTGCFSFFYTKVGRTQKTIGGVKSGRKRTQHAIRKG